MVRNPRAPSSALDTAAWSIHVSNNCRSMGLLQSNYDSVIICSMIFATGIMTGSSTVIIADPSTIIIMAVSVMVQLLVVRD